jgi:hypothetical protein
MKKESLMKMLGLLFLTLVFGVQLVAQSCPAPPPAFEKAVLEGTWKGSHTFEGKTYNLSATISLNDEQLKAKLDVPYLDLKQTDFMAWTCQSNELHLRFDLSEGKAVKFVGRPNGNTLTGRFVYNEESNVCGKSTDVFKLEKTNTSVAKARIFKFD